MLRILSSKLSAPPRAPVALLLAAAAAGAAWLSQGLIALAGDHASRLGLLPWSAVHILLSLLAGAVVFWTLRRRARPAPLLLLILVVVPWLPVPWPPALLVWTGATVLVVWLGVALALVAQLQPRSVVPRPRLAAGVLAALLGGLTWWQVSALVPGGDEPHYLVITQSLLADGDLRIENNHRQRDYRAYVEGDLRPDFRVRGRNGEIYSIHAPGVSALVAPAFALAGYNGVVLFLLVLAGCTGALTWHLAWLATSRSDAAWFGWVAVVGSVTFLFHTFAVYPDGPAALAVLSGAWALARTDREAENGTTATAPWLLHGAALALLPWLHTRFSVLAAGLGALVLLRLGRTPNALAKTGAFLAIPFASAAGWIAYFVSIYGTPDPSIPYGGEAGSFAFVPDGLAGLLFDQRFGLFHYAPVLLLAVAGIAFMLAERARRRSAMEMLFVLLPYLLVVTYVAMWWGGTSAPARFLVPVLPWLAVPAAVAWTRLTSPASRAVALGSLALTLFASAVLVFVDDGRLAFNVREAPARWLEWLNGSVDLARGLPIWWREDETPLFRGIAIWGVLVGGAWFAARRLERIAAFAVPGRFGTATAAVFAFAAMSALTVAWAFEGVSGRAPANAQLDALRRLSNERTLIAIDLRRMRAISRDAIPALLTIRPEVSQAPGGAGRNDRPLYSVAAVPAGIYRLRFDLAATEGWMMIGIGRDQFALRTEPLAAAQQPIDLYFPIDVRALLVRVDEDARRNVRALTIEPQRIVPPSERLADGYARRGVRYEGAIAYFMDDRSFPEPEAFWVGGARSSSIVLQPDQRRSAATLQLRNGPVENTVALQSGDWRDQVRLGPGEERRIDVPLDVNRGATLLQFTTTSGFTPSAVDPRSRDDRYLGVWVKIGP